MALIEELDDRTLVEQHRAGDDEAFRQIVLRHRRSVYANALRRLRDPVLAEDAVQETFLQAFRHLDRFEGEYHLDAWLHRIVTNTCHDIGRRQGRDTRLFDRACAEVEVEAPPADDGIAVLPDENLGRALDQLPERYREALLLRFVDEMSYTDVAQRAGISEQNARARVSRGRTMLRRMLSGIGALVVWAIPPLRRAQLQVQDPDVASNAVHQVHSLTTAVSTAAPAVQTPAVSQLTTLVAQAGPTVAAATPTLTGTAPVVKAAMAAGLAVAVAVPTGVAVERSVHKPVPQSAAPMVDDQQLRSESPSDPVEVSSSAGAATSKAPTSHDTSVSALSASGGIVGSVGGVTTSTSVAPSTTTTPTSAPATTTTTTTAVAPPSGSEQTPGPPPPASAEPVPAPVPAPTGDLRTVTLAVTDAGPRDDHLRGRFTIIVGDQQYSGTLDGKLGIDAAAPKDASAPRAADGHVVLTLDDATVLELSLVGTASVTDQGPVRSAQLQLRYRLTGGSALALAESGSLTGTYDSRDGDGSLAIQLPGQSS